MRYATAFSFYLVFTWCSSSYGQRPFRPTDDVGIALFEYAGIGAPGGVIKYSPNTKYIAVVTERGRLDLNAPEDTIWVFRTEDAQCFVQHPEKAKTPTPLALVQASTGKDGPQIEHVRWLPDSSGIAFTELAKSTCCKFHQLFLADVRTGVIRALTPEDQDIGEFDIRSSDRFVYEVNAPELLTPLKSEEPISVALTGTSLWNILFPDADQHPSAFNAAGLWAMVNGERRHVLDSKAYQAPLGLSGLSLSPDGRSVVAILKVKDPPEAIWSRYKAPPGYEKMKLPLDTSGYYLIDLNSGSKKLLVNAPYGMNQDWSSYLAAAWSEDGQSLLLPSTFFPLDVTDAKEISDRETHPYIAVLRLRTGQLSKVLPLKAGMDKERYAVKNARFEDDETVVVNFDRSYFLPDQPPSATFRQDVDGKWHQGASGEDPLLAKLAIKVLKRESIDQPPQLVGEDKGSGASRVIWDPNPQLKDVELGSAQVIDWKGKSGYEWEAGLVKPPHYALGKRYPLVIQTHGFSKGMFLSGGSFTSAFAARALAAQGILVLQMGENSSGIDTPREGLDQVAGFKSAVKELSQRGLIDPARVGVIGFSRTVYHVLTAITTADHLFAAASVTDGVTLGYFEYLFAVDSGFSREADAINGGKPFGAKGLKGWLARSPEFNMDRVRTPLLLLQPGVESTFADWEPYAALRYLKRPVDLIMLQSGSHVMTNPRQRLAAETINVDWFRFWLLGEEDPDPAKADQYARWRELRKLQVENDTKAAGAN
jgi:dipeptidyl aminopeptidase/acylaminoacyl peptidase